MQFSYSKNKDGSIDIADKYDFKNSYTDNGKGNLKKDYLDNASSGYQTYRKELAEEAYTEGESLICGALPF
ncbi:hypothetical protein [Sphingobacterium hotanense]|uniref:hypothetical protein n=1 Tax=Sphingobacterium hotanense TaxID=649196 RepID=UPI0021A3924C|nr:hypothetical protein [Sphingobacterium hotanense]MCT1525752.1 hypothetical protein [Sphingobacterium hotanense]